MARHNGNSGHSKDNGTTQGNSPSRTVRGLLNMRGQSVYDGLTNSRKTQGRAQELNDEVEEVIELRGKETGKFEGHTPPHMKR